MIALKVIFITIAIIIITVTGYVLIRGFKKNN